MPNPAKDLDFVLLNLHPAAASITPLTSLELMIDLGRVNR
jgi:hypothetical protein